MELLLLEIYVVVGLFYCNYKYSFYKNLLEEAVINDPISFYHLDYELIKRLINFVLFTVIIIWPLLLILQLIDASK